MDWLPETLKWFERHVGERMTRIVVWFVLINGVILAIAFVIVPYVIVPIRYGIHYYDFMAKFEKQVDVVNNGWLELDKAKADIENKLSACERGESCDTKQIRSELENEVDRKHENLVRQSNDVLTSWEKAKEIIEYYYAAGIVFAIIGIPYLVYIIVDVIGKIITRIKSSN